MSCMFIDLYIYIYIYIYIYSAARRVARRCAWCVCRERAWRFGHRPLRRLIVAGEQQKPSCTTL